MDDHSLGAEPLCIVNGLQRVMPSAVPFRPADGSALVTVRCRTMDLNRKRTEIVEARHRHGVICEEMFDPFPQRLSDTVTQFNTIETECEDFA